MRVVFRADAALHIGSGHVMRCRTLAEALRERGAEVGFICREHEGHLCDVLEADGFAVHRLPAGIGVGPREPAHGPWLGASSEREIADTVAALGGAADLFVVDHYALERRFERAVRPAVRRLMVIDDLADRDHDCDLLLDQNLCAGFEQRYEGRVPAGCRLLLGPRYSLLRPAFNALRTAARVATGRLRHVNVFFGGSDPPNMTLRAVEALRRVKHLGVTADIVVGSANPHRAGIEVACEGIRDFRLHVQTPEMPALMASADLAIGAGGSVHWERCMLQLPALVTTIAENQKAPSAELARRGACVLLGSAEEVDAQGIAAELERLARSPARLQAMSLAAGRVVAAEDGLPRVLKALEHHFNGEPGGRVWGSP